MHELLSRNTSLDLKSSETDRERRNKVNTGIQSEQGLEAPIHTPKQLLVLNDISRCMACHYLETDALLTFINGIHFCTQLTEDFQFISPHSSFVSFLFS